VGHGNDFTAHVSQCLRERASLTLSLFRFVARGYLVFAVDDLPAAFHESFYARAREKDIGGSGRAHFNPLGLFLHTSIPFLWNVLIAFQHAGAPA
jgi:hypothetical protein